ncbi:MAG: DUF2279 domain-containing protein [Ignavibacteriae bacterium]|nr:DUF2279 domain-containing protein [Ignavibacteriota bacterium]
MRINFIFFTLILFHSLSAQTFEKDSLNTNRLLLVGGLTAGAFIYAYGIQNDMWWKGEPASFHTNWTQDWNASLGADKIGHFYFGNLVSTIYKDAFHWTGFSKKNSLLYAGLFTLTYQTFLEVRDGFSQQYGFSWGDFTANSLGSMYPFIQHNYPILQNFNLKISYSPSKRFENGSHAYIMDDYESIYHWLSIDFDKLLPGQWDDYVPDFINVAIGHSVTGLDNLNYRNHEFYFGIDWDLTSIRSESDLLNSIIEILNKYHLPAPTVKVYPNVIWYGLKF